MSQIQIDIPEIKEFLHEVKVQNEANRISRITGGRNVVTIKDIAHLEGCSESQLRRGGRERYLLPRFGESGYPTGTTRWDNEEYVRWYLIPREERRKAYLEHLRNQAKKSRMKHA